MAAAAAALLEDELQQSLATSEDDAEFEEDDELAADIIEENADAYAANHQLHNGMLDEDESDPDELEDGIEEDEDMLSDEDAEGEDDDEIADPAPDFDGEDEEGEDDRDEEEDEDAEGVGAVKIQPGQLEDDEDVLSGTDDEDDESVPSVEEEDDDESKGSSDVEVGARWDPAADEEDDEEPVNPNRCMCVKTYSAFRKILTISRFCQQDEESDPSEIFELYLACDVCGDNGKLIRTVVILRTMLTKL